MKDWENEMIFKEYLKKDKFNSYSIYFGKNSVKTMFLDDGIVKVSHSGFSERLKDTSPYIKQRFLKSMREMLK